jgi:hypothetical protein
MTIAPAPVIGAAVISTTEVPTAPAGRASVKPPQISPTDSAWDRNERTVARSGYWTVPRPSNRISAFPPRRIAGRTGRLGGVGQDGSRGGLAAGPRLSRGSLRVRLVATALCALLRAGRDPPPPRR